MLAVGGKPRIRRRAEEAREIILEAAEARLRERGPDGLRLQSLAADVGVSHPTILHHFGSRTGLVEAVIERTTARLRHEVVTALTEVAVEELDSAALLERVFTSLADRGQARTLAWLFLAQEGGRTDPVDYGRHLRAIAETMHAIRQGELGADTPDLEDTLFTVLLASLALVGNSLGGAALRRSAGLEVDPAADHRFIVWLAQLLHHHLESPRPP
jgi:AcrR family transcriptional regulator